MMWLLYEILLLSGLVACLPRALWRRRIPHRGWSMRLGRYGAASRALQGRAAIWVHAVSVGEVLAARPLLGALEEALGGPLVLSSVTPGGFAVASKELNGRGVAVYFPLDLRPCVRRALDAIRPRLLLLVELELWPLVIRLAHARRVPIAVVNGRMSGRAFSRYRLIRPWLAGTLRRVDLFLMQSQEDAARILALGAPPERVRVTGNLKWDASLGSRPDPETIAKTADRLGLAPGRRVLVAGSTHRGEERALLAAYLRLRASHPTLRLILAPRHLERLAEVEQLVQERGLPCARFSTLAGGVDWTVGLVDTFGELVRYYGVADLVFIGGSLIPHGGQNPLEAASLGKPIAFGPFMHNFGPIAHQLLAHHAARQVPDKAALVGFLAGLLDRPGEAEAMGRRARELTEQFQGAARRTLEALQPLMARDVST